MILKNIVLIFLLAFSLISVYAGEKDKEIKNPEIGNKKETGMVPDSDAARGKLLFNDATFASRAIKIPCNTCHPNGKRLENLGDRKEFHMKGVKLNSLEEAVNYCIKNHCKGKELNPKSKEMAYIIAYIKSLKK